MATSKTLAPTNQTIQIPAMGDAPDASVFSNCIDKEADAINSLNSQTWKKTEATYTGGVDANNYTTAGFYAVGITSHSPFGANAAYGVLMVFTTNQGGVQQMFIAGHNGNLYIRGKNTSSDSFSVWHRVSTTAQSN